MSYSLPSSDAIDLPIESYTAPPSDAIDFTIGGSIDDGDTTTKTALVSGITDSTTTVGTATTNTVGQTNSNTDPITSESKSDETRTTNTNVETKESLSTVQLISQNAALAVGQTSTSPLTVLEITDNGVSIDDIIGVLYPRRENIVKYTQNSKTVIYKND